MSAAGGNGVPGADATAEARAEMVQVLAGLNYDVDLALAQKTRRAVRSAAIVLAERRVHQRRTVGIAVAAIVSFAILLAPVIWNIIGDLDGGGQLVDMPMEFLFLFMMLTPAVLAALFVGWKRQRDVHHDRSF